jgi:hypothetical protein
MLELSSRRGLRAAAFFWRMQSRPIARNEAGYLAAHHFDRVDRFLAIGDAGSMKAPCPGHRLSQRVRLFAVSPVPLR